MRTNRTKIQPNQTERNEEVTLTGVVRNGMERNGPELNPELDMLRKARGKRTTEQV